jgi:site-specific DNA-adenine methylase
MSYQGGKGAGGVAETIINKMPKHKRYIETHLGGGRVILKKKPAIENIAIEIDKTVLNNFINNTKRKDIQYYNMGIISFLKLNIELFTKDTLVYSDPPYVFSTRKNKKPIYNYEYDDRDHIELLTELNKLDCFVMISGYNNKIYENILTRPKWLRYDFNAMTRRGIRVESLWCNFDPNNFIKHDYSFMGEDFRERERIRRKAKRWINNLSKLPTDERNYLLFQIANNFGLELSNHF